MSSFICSKETKSKITALIYAETYHPGKIRRLFWGDYSDKIKKVIEQYAEKYLNVDRVKEYNAEQVIFWILEDINAEAVSVLIDRTAPDGQKIKTAEQIREQNPEDCDLLAICNDGKQYPARYNQKLKLIFFAIPHSVKIIGYIGA